MSDGNNINKRDHLENRPFQRKYYYYYYLLFLRTALYVHMFNYYFLVTIYGRESISGSNFRNGDFDRFTRYEVP